LGMRKSWEWLALFLGVGAVSWGGPLVRCTSAPALTVAAWRMLLSAAVFLPFGFRSWRGKEVRSAIIAGAFLAAHFAFWIQSLRLTSVASSVVLVNTNPLFVGLFSWLLGEVPSRSFWIGVTISLVGTILIGLGDFSLSSAALLGDVLAVLGALAASGYLLLGRSARKTMSLIPYASLTYFSAALFLWPAALAFASPLPQSSDWLWIALIALIPQVLGHTTLNWALGRFPAFAVAVSILGEPIGAALWAFLLFGEKPHPVQGVGMALVIFGILGSLRPNKI
jgi:drug/metabolite transporter (DMT)-like permease